MIMRHPQKQNSSSVTLDQFLLKSHLSTVSHNIAGHEQNNGEKEKLGSVEFTTRSYFLSYQDFPVIQETDPFCFPHNVLSFFFFFLKR